MRFASLVSLAGLVVLGACEQGYAVEGNVTASPDLTPAGPVGFEIVVEGSATPLAGDWLPTSSHDISISDTFDSAPAPYRYDEFGMAPHALYVGAFLDLDGNGLLDPGEPFGVFAGNPIIDAPSGWFTDPVKADLVIDSVLETPAAD
jgi:hypothetical protein